MSSRYYKICSDKANLDRVFDRYLYLLSFKTKNRVGRYHPVPISFEHEDRRKNYKKLNDSFGGSEIELLSWVGMTDHARAQMSLDALQYSPILGLSKIIFLFVQI